MASSIDAVVDVMDVFIVSIFGVATVREPSLSSQVDEAMLMPTG
jgi:hypothetical protein